MSNIEMQGIVSEKPQNGLAGLKHWRHDVVAGLLVSLTSLPLSLGIAVASGAPPIAGLVSAIVAGLVLPFLGGSYVTISGPAAGLAPALMGAMIALGHGHLEAGYPLLLAVIAMVGVIQIALSRLGAARLSLAFPAAVVEGMLAAIGLMIIAKEMPHLIGHPYRAHDFFGIVRETPAELALLNPKVLTIGLVGLAMMFVLPKVRGLRRVPAPLAVVLVGMVMSRALGVGGPDLIHVPDNILQHGIVLPDFAGLFADHSLFWVMVTAVLTLVLIDGTESLATIAAIDKIDPFRRKSDPDRTLLAMGVSNVCSSLVGGLTIIPGGVKSKVCINGGGRTLWANFANACFLLVYLFVARSLINLIPYASLAAILIYTGYRMSEPALWRHVAHIGTEQLVLFGTTVAVTLATDLLVGLFVGMAVKLVLNLAFSTRHGHGRDPARAGASIDLAAFSRQALVHLGRFFGNPVSGRERVADCYILSFDRPMVCFNAPHLSRELRQIPDDIADVVLRFGAGVSMIDHTTCDNLLHFADEYKRSGRGRVALVGLDRMHKRSPAENSARLAPAPTRAEPLVAAPVENLIDNLTEAPCPE